MIVISKEVAKKISVMGHKYYQEIDTTHVNDECLVFLRYVRHFTSHVTLLNFGAEITVAIHASKYLKMTT